MRRLVMSDSHGGYRAMQQCLEKCAFDEAKDTLYFLGDVVDGWSETKESIDLLLRLPHLVFLLGNHDQWALQYYSGTMLQDDSLPNLWLMQGGAATVKSYGAGKPMPPAHLQFLQGAASYHVTEDNILLVHAGFDPEIPIAQTNTDYLLWSRDFIRSCYSHYTRQQPLHIEAYKEVYIGHTPTLSLNPKQLSPLRMGNVTDIDTGAAFSGRLSLLDIDSKEVWQSEEVRRLYPDEKGRNGSSWNELSGNS